MEACLRKHVPFLFRNFKPQFIGWNGLRSYSQYDSNFKNPIVDNQIMDETFEKFSKIELQAMKFKALQNDKNCFIFYDADVNKMTNYIMRGGRKKLARRILEEGFTKIKHIQLRKYNSETNPEIKNKICLDPLKIFHEAVKNVTPKVITRNVRKSGRWYKIPSSILPKEGKVFGMKWIVQASNTKENKERFFVSFAHELIAASQNEGKAVNKKMETYKLCEANRSYAHYRWG